MTGKSALTTSESYHYLKESDIVIIGGGAIGLATAYWLKVRNPRAFQVTVIEKDPCYKEAATTLSVGGIRQQFSLPENVMLSMYTAQFLREIKEHLSVLDFDPPDVQFNPQGYLFLATEAGNEILKENNKVQRNCGAKVQLMKTEQLKDKFPWMVTDDITYGSYGLENEGWFDPWLYIAALKTKLASFGVQFVTGEVVGFRKDKKVTRFAHRMVLEMLDVRLPDSSIFPIKMAKVVNCAGPWSGQVAELAGIGCRSQDSSALIVPLPVEPRKRYVYMFHCPDGPGLDMPFLVDPSGVYVRREGLGGHYLCGKSPVDDNAEPSAKDLEVDHEFFNEHIWPVLAQRVPAFERLKVKNAWSGYYDYNYFDQNLIIGNHPYYDNFYMATGCSGHGIQQSAAVGRAMAELILDDEYKTIDLSRFSFDRILEDKPYRERNII
eukprot:GHVO01059301.1.p1 GENE.GHVO01059301.1~~GHVO01059301.1.p1  ORF type:complete len:473 (-),score=31.08 GHVO01059301.1:161-1468(-)